MPNSLFDDVNPFDNSPVSYLDMIMNGMHIRTNRPVDKLNLLADTSRTGPMFDLSQENGFL